MENFTSLAQASKIISEITEQSKTMYDEGIKSSKGEVIEQIVNYIHELFKPLYDLNFEFGMTYKGLSITKQGGVVSLYKNIPMGGWADTFRVNMNKEGISRYNALSHRMTVEIAESWHYFKGTLNNHLESKLKRVNDMKKKEVDKMAKELDIINNFVV